MTHPFGSVAVAILLGLSSIGLVACGSDTPSREDFVTKIRSITNPPVDRQLAECAYDKLQGNQRLLKLATTNSTIPAKDDTELSKILADCILNGGSTTTAPKKSTTTTPKKKSTPTVTSKSKKSSSNG